VPLLALFSAKGSPGVSTTAMLIAALWPRPSLLVDADPMGGDVALRMTAPDGNPLRTDRGLLSLLPLARRGLAPEVVLDHAQVALGGQQVVSGLAGPEQSRAVGPLWSTLATAFADLPGHDVVVDAGRAHSGAVHLPILQQADVLVCVLRPNVAGVVHARERLRALYDALHRADGSLPRVGLVCIEEVQRQREALAAIEAVQFHLPWVESFGQVALDPKAAQMFDGVPVSRPERSMLVRSGRRVTDTLAQSVRRADATGQMGGAAGAPTGDARESADEVALPGRVPVAVSVGASPEGSTPATRAEGRAGRRFGRRKERP
jgi:MinD-like ATPase involved in chromosome partitioning or flagellar assembly